MGSLLFLLILFIVIAIAKSIVTALSGTPTPLEQLPVSQHWHTQTFEIPLPKVTQKEWLITATVEAELNIHPKTDQKIIFFDLQGELNYQITQKLIDFKIEDITQSDLKHWSMHLPRKIEQQVQDIKINQLQLTLHH